MFSFLFFPTVHPRVTLTSGPVHIEGGKNASLPKCFVTGNPPPKVTWSKVLGQLPINRSVITNGQLSLVNVQKSDSGLYTCRASNHLGTHSAQTLLVIMFPPRLVTRPPSAVSVVAGQTMQIKCSAKGDPRPVVTWKRTGGQLPVGRAKVVDDNLVIRRMTAKDSGMYICTASSSALLKRAEATVTITATPCMYIFVRSPAYSQLILRAYKKTFLFCFHMRYSTAHVNKFRFFLQPIM